VGWFFRRSVGFGPLRVNFSKSGIGYSLGVRGARIGINSRGNYVRLGRGGIYYQKYLSTHSSRATDPKPPSPQLIPPAPPQIEEWGTPIQTADAASLRDASADELLHEIQQKHSKIRLARVSLVVFSLVLLIFLVNNAPLWVLVLAIALGVASDIVLRGHDAEQKTVFLDFDLDAEARKQYVELLQSVQSLATAARIWRVARHQTGVSRKYHAGAGTVVDRKPVSLVLAPPPYVQTKLAIWRLALGDQNLYFFPDRVLVYQGGRVGAISYRDLQTEVVETRFAEEQGVPWDARVIGQTWRFTNRNGGPDRRFSNNRAIPWANYGDLLLQSSTGFNVLLVVSNPQKARNFKSGIDGYSAEHRATHV
jgi:hypothetical protein